MNFFPFVQLGNILREKIARASKSIASASVKSELLSLSPRLFLETVFITVIALSFIFAFGDPTGLADVAGIMVILGLGVRSIPIVSNIISNFGKVLASQPIIEDIELLMARVASGEHLVNVDVFVGKEALTIKEARRFKTSFKCVRGKVTCIVGRSGVGKSHLLSNIANSIARDFPGQIYYGPQEPFVLTRFDDNLTHFSPITSRGPLSLDRLEATKEILEALSVPYFEKVTDHSARDGLDVKSFSGGEIRKISLLRALLWPGDIVILDEPFVGMDVVSMRAALDLLTIEARDKFILIASHGIDRLSDEANKVNIVELSQCH